jgi:hypothetical protein
MEEHRLPKLPDVSTDRKTVNPHNSTISNSPYLRSHGRGMVKGSVFLEPDSLLKYEPERSDLFVAFLEYFRQCCER